MQHRSKKLAQQIDAAVETAKPVLAQMKDQFGSPERGRSRLAELSEAVNQQFGIHTAMPISRAGYARVRRLPTGIFMLDYLTHGGIPFNKFTRLWGPRSSLKSTGCLQIIRQAQMHCRHCKYPIVEDSLGMKDCRCPKPRYMMADPRQFGLLNMTQSIQIADGLLPAECNGTELLVTKAGKKVAIKFIETERCEPLRTILVDAEMSSDIKWIRANGVDPELVTVVGAKWAEQALDTVEMLMLSTEFDLVIVDSVSALTPTDTIVKSMSDAPKMAVKATLMTRAFNKWMSAMTAQGLMNIYAPTMVLVQQIRNTGIGKPWAARRPSASEAEEHAISLDIKLEAKGYKHKGSEVKYGNFAFKVCKNKVGGAPDVHGEFCFWMNPDGEGRLVGDTDDIGVVLKLALEHTIGLEHSAGKYTLRGELVPDGAVVLKTITALRQYFTDNKSIYADLRERVMQYMIDNGIVISKPDEEQDGLGAASRLSGDDGGAEPEVAGKVAPKYQSPKRPKAKN